jgi:hypothetical protein
VWNPAFVACLTRLADYRGRAEPSLDSPTSDASLRRIAVELDLPVVDLFVLAGLPLPDDLSPVDRLAGKQVDDLVRITMRLDGPARSRLLTTARSVVECRQVLEFAPIQYGPSPGAAIFALLRARNLDHFTTAPVLKMMTGRYVASSVIGNIGLGRVRLTPEWLADLGAVLGMPAGLLSAMTGLEVAEVPRAPEVTDAAEVIWTVRRFTLYQVQALVDAA